MGYMKHHAIVCTSWNWEALAGLHDDARNIFGGKLISPLVEGLINKYYSFMIAPDGSKEGWEESDKCDTLRNEFKEQIKAYNYSDGSNPIDWVEVSFDEDGEKEIVR